MQDIIVRIPAHAGKHVTGAAALGNILMFVINKTNLLPAEDFQEVQDNKNNIINKGTGALTLNLDGTITKDTRLKEGVDTPKYTNDYIVSPDAYFNFQGTTEGFEKLMGKTFVKVLDAIKQVMIENNLESPKPYMCRAYRHNVNIRWHKHGFPKFLKPHQFWLSIFYMHPNWDTKYGGKLHIGQTEQEVLHTFDCLSNSVVLHNGYFGHSVNDLILGYEGDRDIFLTHWATGI